MNSDHLKFTSFRPFPHAEKEELKRTGPALQELRRRGVGIPTPILWDLLQSASAQWSRRGEQHGEIKSAEAWHQWLKSQWQPLVVVAIDSGTSRRHSFPIELIHRLAARIETVGEISTAPISNRKLRSWTWKGGPALRAIVDRCEDPMEILGLASVLEHASGILRADPFLANLMGATPQHEAMKTLRGRRSDASAMTDTTSAWGEFDRRDPSRMPDDPSRLAPMEHLYLDAVPDYFWQRAAENALVQRFHRRSQDADRRLRAEIVIALHDDISLHRFESSSRPPINDYRFAFALSVCAVQKLAHAADADIDLLVEYQGPMSDTSVIAKIPPDVRTELDRGDSRIALLHLGRLIPAFVSHHPTPPPAGKPQFRQSTVEYDRIARLQLGPIPDGVKRDFDEEHVIECIRDSHGRWRVGASSSGTLADGLDLNAASDLAASRVLGISDRANQRAQTRPIEWRLA